MWTIWVGTVYISWLARLSLYVRQLVLIVMVSQDQPCVPRPAMFWSNQKSQPEMDIYSQKLTRSLSKIQVAPTYHRPKPNGFWNNNDSANKMRESTGSVNSCDYLCGWHQQTPNQNRFKSQWWFWRARPLAVKHCTAEDVIFQEQINAPWVSQMDVWQMLPFVIDWDWTGRQIGGDFG